MRDFSAFAAQIISFAATFSPMKFGGVKNEQPFFPPFQL
jgi:hypothetical protein